MVRLPISAATALASISVDGLVGGVPLSTLWQSFAKSVSESRVKRRSSQRLLTVPQGANESIGESSPGRNLAHTRPVTGLGGRRVL